MDLANTPISSSLVTSMSTSNSPWDNLFVIAVSLLIGFVSTFKIMNITTNNIRMDIM